MSARKTVQPRESCGGKRIVDGKKKMNALKKGYDEPVPLRVRKARGTKGNNSIVRKNSEVGKKDIIKPVES